jgi:hypothetical protein
MLNKQFEIVGKAVKAIDGKAKGIFGAILAFAIEVKPTDVEQLRGYIKAQEQIVGDTMKVKLGGNSTYKVAKGKVLKAVELGIPLVGKNGKPVGKTALEDAIKAKELELAGPAAPVKAPATPFDNCMVALGVLADEAKKIEDKDIVLLCGPMQATLDALMKRIPQPKAA